MAVRRGWEDAVDRSRTRAWNMVRENWHLGFTSFGGPPVHFKIVSYRASQPSGAITDEWWPVPR